MKNIHLNRYSLNTGSFAIKRLIARLPYILLIERFTMVRLVLLILLGILALYIVVTLLYLGGSPEENAAVDRPIVLQIDVIDELEVWVEERQTERERNIVPAGRVYFES